MKFLVIKKGTLLFIYCVGFTLIAISAWFLLKAGDTVVFNQQQNKNAREIHMVTGRI